MSIAKSDLKKAEPGYVATARHAERRGAACLVALGVICLLGSLAATGVYFAHSFPILNNLESLATIAGSPAVGGIALLSYGIYKFKQNAEQVHLTWGQQAEANIQLLLQNPEHNPSHFEVVGEEGSPKIETVNICRYALRRLKGSLPEDTASLQAALGKSIRNLENSSVTAAKYSRFFQNSSLLKSLNCEPALPDAPVLFVEKIQSNSDAYVQPIYKNGKWYHSHNQSGHVADAGCIFAATHLNRLGRAMTFGQCCKYFSQDETEEQIYQSDPPMVSTTEPSVQNIGHATLLFQLGGLNVLTDPVFGDLGPGYSIKTRPGLKPEQLPPIDVVLISHNHRDHCDIDSLTQLRPHQPKMLVPRGDFKLFKDLGFIHVYDHDWWTTTVISRNNENFIFHAVPACHWSGRGAFDAHESLICSWVFRRSDQSAIYFRGDSAVVPPHVMQQICEFSEVPIRVNFEPGGPNHPRQWMESTHQSVLDSMLSHFEVTNKPEEGATYLMHHNAYELGTDRFNEAVIIKNQILVYLKAAYRGEERLTFLLNDPIDVLPDFVKEELLAGKLTQIEKIGVSRFTKEMETHFFSPKIGQRMPLALTLSTNT